MAQSTAGKVYFDREAVLKARRREYETICVLSPAIDESRVKALMAKALEAFESAGGVVLRNDDWGKLRLPHEMKQHMQARYFYIRSLSSADAIKAFERAMKLEADFLVFQTVKLSEDLSEDQIEVRKKRAPQEKVNPPFRSDDEEADIRFR